MRVRNYEHNSGKPKKGRGVSKGLIRARKQALKALKRRLVK